MRGNRLTVVITFLLIIVRVVMLRLRMLRARLWLRLVILVRSIARVL
jgi:hypothetical protein